ncbi:MAG: hypothetical protein A2X16_06115 [Bacteroidetes bacterium GWF2_39_10]|nr:MAG: hypothetical protein A2X16_06115 [Bacteroidetes bacterium GWF2_39_10]
MKKLIFILIIAITACRNSSDNQPKDLRIIDVEGGVGKGRLVKLSEIAESIEYIPLETNSEAVVGKIFFERIFYEKGFFYLMEQNRSIFIHDNDGKYFNKINKLGRGPHEYDTTFDMDVDIITGNIYVLASNKIIEYSLDGDFKKVVNYKDNGFLSKHYIIGFIKSDLNYFLLSTINDRSQYSGFLIDSSLRLLLSVEYPGEDYEKVTTYSALLSIMDPMIFRHKNAVRIKNGYNKHIISINRDLSIDTVYIFSFGKYTADLLNSSHFLSRSPYIWNRFEIFESDQYLFMIFHVGPLADKPAKMIGMRGNQYDYQHDCSFFNKRTGEFQFIHQPEINQLGFVEDFEGGPAVWPKYVSSDGYMITYLYAHEFKAHAETHEVSDKFKSIADNLKDTDNPVIVRVKLKN